MRTSIIVMSFIAMCASAHGEIRVGVSADYNIGLFVLDNVEYEQSMVHAAGISCSFYAGDLFGVYAEASLLYPVFGFASDSDASGEDDPVDMELGNVDLAKGHAECFIGPALNWHANDFMTLLVSTGFLLEYYFNASPGSPLHYAFLTFKVAASVSLLLEILPDLSVSLGVTGGLSTAPWAIMIEPADASLQGGMTVIPKIGVVWTLD